ncbi:2,3-butanediol dehydrogenase [Nocardia sp. CA2R105]|uniref:2,3-butanediol dehydrogenase n=1 Tax=Nocardia coffeae TaxID=2873381 RepID=UPI001CA6F699|nr:2,3-butanediol dehydrogenase [Nocardia coffeae]MBY8857261.1 2,3-butanediol dehydrogenase [Nocardia coffeae]
MKAARFHGRCDLRIDEIEEPAPAAGEVKIRNAYVGICGSDLHVYFDPEHCGLDFSKPHPVTGSMPPQILGHEFSGTVVELGDGVDDIAVGDRVAVWPVYYCGDCAACRAGMVNICRSFGFHGLTSHGGGLAEYTTVARSMVHRLPETVDLKLGALVEPMAVAWHAVEHSGVQQGQAAVIAGAGAIGLGLWFALRARGITNIVVSDPNTGRRQVAEQLGVPHVIDPTATDLVAVCAELTAGAGADVAFDAAGTGSALTQALDALGPGGRLVVVAVHGKDLDFDTTRLVFSERSITGSLAYLPADFDAVIAAMAAGSYDPAGWVEEAAMDDVVATFHRLHEGAGTKVLIRV